MSDPAAKRGPDDIAGLNLRMTRPEYLRWAEARPSGRYERINGLVIAMAPERVGHLERKAQAWLALRTAIHRSGMRCQVLPDGATVSVGDSDFEPDALVRCGSPLPSSTVVVPDPVIIVEVLSPSTRVIDLTLKADAYFKIGSLWHYLIVFPDQPRVIHHRRTDRADPPETQVVTGGDIRLDPPGISITLEELYAE